MAASPLSPASAPMSSDDTKGYACSTCVQRKVKCDKRQPCLACVRSRLQCKYRTTPPPQRRKRKVDSNNQDNQELLERLRAHEATLRGAGLPFESVDDVHNAAGDHDEADGEAVANPRGRSLPAAPVESLGISPQKPHPPQRGFLIPEYGGKRYYEHGLFGVLGQEYKQDPMNFVNLHSLGDTTNPGVHGSQQGVSDMLTSSVLTALPSPQASPQYQHPPAGAVMKYWNIFVENVHPLTKIVHAPTVYEIMIDSTSSVPRTTDALKHSIYACAVASLTDRECQKTFAESQASLLQRFQSATRYALLESSFLCVPDIDLLRAHILLLTSMFHTSDTSSLWVLMGSAIRMAQSQGLHRDGSTLSLSPFEIEMRRRLWWYIVTLDGRLTELMGLESSLPKPVDTLLPSNINDSDIEPSMSTSPQERTGASEMTFCLLKYEIVRFLQDHEHRPDRCEPQVSNGIEKQGDKRNFSDLESFLEDKFIRFCDPVIPIQFLTSTIARSTLCKLRQTAHHRRSRQNLDGPRTTGSEQGNIALNIATRNIEYDNLIHSSRSLRGFLWHVKFYFPWGAPVFVLKNLTSRPEWDDNMQAAWQQIEELYENHPEYLDTDKVNHLIVGGLTLKAWAAREAALESRGMCKQRTPAVIAALQARQTTFLARRSDSRMGTTRVASEEINFADMTGFDSITAANFDLVDPTFAGVDWSNWEGY